MNPNEIRLNSIVLHKGKTCRIINIGSGESQSVIGKDGLKLIDNVQMMGWFIGKYRGVTWGKFDEYEPAPITDEILLKSGFEKQEFGNDIRFVGNGIILWNKYAFVFGDTEIKVEYIHHLQNIILDLTGEEWKVNL